MFLTNKSTHITIILIIRRLFFFFFQYVFRLVIASSRFPEQKNKVRHSYLSIIFCQYATSLQDILILLWFHICIDLLFPIAMRERPPCSFHDACMEVYWDILRRVSTTTIAAGVEVALLWLSWIEVGFERKYSWAIPINERRRSVSMSSRTSFCTPATTLSRSIMHNVTRRCVYSSSKKNKR